MGDADYARVSAMIRGRRVVRTVPLPIDFPGYDGDGNIEAGVRILLDDEVDDGRLDAVQYIQARAKKHRMDAVTLLAIEPELLDREETRQTVYRAFVEPGEYDNEDERPRFFPSVTAIRQLDTTMIETLFGIYLDHQNYVSPLRGVDEAEVAELAEALGKGLGAEVMLGQYDAPSLRTLLRTLAAQFTASRTGRSDGGSRDT